MLWYDWEYVQSAREDHHYLGGDRYAHLENAARRFSAYAEKCYLRPDGRRYTPEEVIKAWLQHDTSAVRDWLNHE